MTYARNKSNTNDKVLVYNIVSIIKFMCERAVPYVEVLFVKHVIDIKI